MTFDEFVAKYAETVRDMQNIWDQRPGQWAMNLLHQFRPDIYGFFSGWYPVDPFYRDDFLPRFWEELAVKW